MAGAASEDGAAGTTGSGRVRLQMGALAWDVPGRGELVNDVAGSDEPVGGGTGSGETVSDEVAGENVVGETVACKALALGLANATLVVMAVEPVIARDVLV